MLSMILDTAPQLCDNINLFGFDGHWRGGVSSTSWNNKCADQGDKMQHINKSSNFRQRK